MKFIRNIEGINNLSRDSKRYYQESKDNPFEIQNKRFINPNQVCQQL